MPWYYPGITIVTSLPCIDLCLYAFMPMILKFTCLYQFQTRRNLLRSCNICVSAWMTGSKLKLNPSQTEFLLIGTKLQREKFLNNFPCLLLGQDTNPSTSAKNLGVLFDSSLNFRKHISQTCRACFYHIRDLILPSKLQWHSSVVS